MSEAGRKLVANLRDIDPNHPLLNAMVEMHAFEQALGSRTAFYHYPLNGTRQRALSQGLVRENTDGLVRLTQWGREVASIAHVF